MNHDEVKQILLIYRPGTSDDQDPEVAAALALVKDDPELSLWFEQHCARQNALREKFRQIPVIAGLKEQIISEESAKARAGSRQKIIGAVAAAVILVTLLIIGAQLLPHHSAYKPAASQPDNTLASFQNRMVYYAVAGYSMDVLTNDATKIQAYLAHSQAPSDYVLTAGLQKTAVTGCAAENWDNAKVSMICFVTGKPLPPKQQSDLWLFVIDRSALSDATISATPQIAQNSGLITATWMQDGKVYLVATAGDESTIKKYL